MTEQTAIYAYRLKLASNPDGEIDFITVEISHSLLSQTYRFVKSTTDLTAYLETGEQVTFTATSMEETSAANSNDSDQQASFTLPDLGNMLDDEMSRIPYDDDEDVVFIYRRYITSDLSYPCEGPVTYDLQTLTQSKGVFTAATGAPRLNERGTGIIATPSVIPLLIGVLST